MSLPKIMSGARAIFRVNNKVVAFATNVNYTVSHPHQAISVLGRYSAARHEPTGVEVSFGCSAMRFTAAGGKGNSPQAAATDRLMPRLQDILSTDELMVEIVDRATDQTLLMVSRARMTQRSGSMGSRDLLSESWTFVGVVAEDDDSGAQQESSLPGTTPPNTAAAE
jgi:hypothetical protein